MPPGVQYADPFLCEHAGRHWLFVEEIPEDRGPAHLTCLEVHADLSLGQPRVVMQRPYHLSYPCVVRDGDAHFMIPETGADGTVQLLVAAHFPYDWEPVATLCDGLPLRDTTPFRLGDVWYFFTTLHECGAETFLFTADELRGPWRYHPANPVCTDTRRARGAGHVFRRGGRLFRPAQDCSTRYGHAIVLNEITRLTRTDYAERPVEVISPTWSPGLLGTHTINRDGAFEVIDGSRLVPRRA